MPYCGPSNTVPSCAAIPTVGFGSDSCGFGSGFGYGGSALGPFVYGGTVPAANLGILQGVHPVGIVQLLPQECTIRPPSVNVAVPGPVLCASPESLQFGGYAPCAFSGSGLGHGGFGSGGICIGGSSYRKSGLLGRRGSVCY